MTDENPKQPSLPFEGRVMPGPVALATIVYQTTEIVFNRLIEMTPVGPERDLVIAEWAAWRDEYKPMLDRILRGR